jgi:uncharacterized protein (DUF305 family)
MSVSTVPESPPGTEQDEGSPRRRYLLAAVAAAVTAGLLLGFAVAALALRPADDTPGDTSAEAGFARDMSRHHAQAVDMGTIALARATTEEVQTLGMDIALTQQSQIGMMQQWLREWDLLPTGTEPSMAWMGEADMVVDGLMPGMATRDEMDRLREGEGTEVDLLFLELMIDHHLGGVHMDEAILDLSDDPEVTWMAEAQLRAQAYEIEYMRQLQDTFAADS